MHASLVKGACVSRHLISRKGNELDHWSLFLGHYHENPGFCCYRLLLSTFSYVFHPRPESATFLLATMIKRSKMITKDGSIPPKPVWVVHLGVNLFKRNEMYAHQAKIWQVETKELSCIFYAFCSVSSPKESTHALANDLEKTRPTFCSMWETTFPRNTHAGFCK